MSHLLFPSAIRPSVIGLALAGALTAGCGSGGDDDCGPGSASRTGMVATTQAATLTYGNLSSGLNNDCPDSAAPTGVVSLTIFGTQTAGTGTVTLCVSRPDLLAGRAQALGHDSASSQVRIVDLSGQAAGCSFTVDRTQPVTGNATSSGLCGNGGDAAGFALTLDGTLSLLRTCGTTVDTVQVTLSGTVAVETGTSS